MHSMRQRRQRISRKLAKRHQQRPRGELDVCDRMPAVGREFGSPDFDRLMEEDYRDRVGVFHPALKE